MNTTKKLTYLLLAMMLFNASSFSQIYDKTKGKNVQAILTRPVMVHTAGDQNYVARLKEAFNAWWKVSPFQFLDDTKGPGETSAETTVFRPVVVGLTVRGNETSMNHPFFVYAEQGTSGRVNGEGIVVAFPINGFHYEFDVTSEQMYNHSFLRLPYMVANLNEMITHLKNNGSEKDYLKTVAQRTSKLASKTLIIPADLLKEWNVNPNTTALMKGNLEAGKKPIKPINAAILEASAITYSGKYKIMSTEEIVKLEQSEDADKYALFLPAIDHHKYILVYDLKTKELLYQDDVTMSMKVKEKDFEKLAKAAGL
ncbi:hypothetical protein [Aridibaculum aurantiacum]|uniref:hypothetical protein n=1 Tax=Aridibaculum aurantiacum TaxID=2810307 RepID=UPI001A95DAEA|nr:hypothetical protein [Aridibaculum aurantiacum]